MNPRASPNIRGAPRWVAWIVGAILGWSFVFANPPPARAAPTDSITLTIGVKDRYPPSAVTDLTATAGGVGQLLLQWTAPEGDDFVFANYKPAANYVVRVATFSADSVGSTTTWWNTAQDVAGEPAPSNPGIQDSLLINGLTGGVTYYAAILSVDAVGNISPIDVKTGTPGQQANAFVFGSPPPTPNNFAGTALDTTSLQWTWDLASGATYYALYAHPSGSLVASTTGLFFIESGFTPNTGVSRRLRAGNINGLSGPTAATTAYTLAEVPTALAITTVTANSVTLTWAQGANPVGTRFRLERSPDGSSFASVATTTALGRTDAGLSALTSYYYRLRAVNEDNVATSPTATVSTVTLAASDILAPEAPMGLLGFLDPTGKAFTLSWEAVTQNANGSALTDLAGYNVYRSTGLMAPKSKLTPTPLSITVFADQVDGKTFYYTIRAQDTTSNESADSLIADSSLLANIIFLAKDSLSSVVMPSSVSGLLRSSQNKYGVPLSIILKELSVPAKTNVIRNVKYQLIRGDTKAEIDDLAFTTPQAIVNLAYNLQGGQVATGAPQGQGQGPAALALTPQQLSLFWNNGVAWIKVGGTLDLNAQSLKTKTSFLGNYQIRAAAAATSLNLDQASIYPRVFTPNGDGFNDRVYFVLENPNNVSVKGEIFDLAGRHVATLPPPTGLGIGTTLSWDGKDSTGSVVPGGAYIYKIEGEGKTFTGSVAVAR